MLYTKHHLTFTTAAKLTVIFNHWINGFTILEIILHEVTARRVGNGIQIALKKPRSLLFSSATSSPGLPSLCPVPLRAEDNLLEVRFLQLGPREPME